MPGLLSPHLRDSLDNSFAADWARQRQTAEVILQRLESQEGVVLADQVGMGKTFVALAVATSQILRSAKSTQVVVFVPSRVAEKWINEWGKFRESLLLPGVDVRCVNHPIRSGEDFIKALDEPAKSRNHLVIVTHEALTATLKDSFIQLALLYYATRGRHNVQKMRGRISMCSDGAKGLIRDRRLSPGIVQQLLNTMPERWQEMWHRLTGQELASDPVPSLLRAAAQEVDLGAVWTAVQALPANRANLEQRLIRARATLNDATQAIWKRVLSAPPRPRRPLLIIDEAHALKNSDTRISRLFTPLPNEAEDGALRGIFERMLLLTATPFELGHNELINVLSRLDAIRSMRPPPATPLKERLTQLGEALQQAQETAIRLDDSWAHLERVDRHAFEAWQMGAEAPSTLSHAAQVAWRDVNFAVEARRRLHQQLWPWVIRHERPHRREYRPGAAIVPGQEAQVEVGLEVPEIAALPFLLAARAQAVAIEDTSGPVRPLFAYGIASSYEAFLRTKDGQGVLDSDDEPEKSVRSDANRTTGTSRKDPARWYRRQIHALLHTEGQREQHPKIAATTARAAALWLAGEKCLIFCWYILTTEALEASLRSRINATIQRCAAERLSVNPETAEARLGNLSARLLKSDTASYRHIAERLHAGFLQATSDDGVLAEALTTIAIRNLRTPAYLVRYTPLSAALDADGLLAGIQGDNPTQINLMARWNGFAARMHAMTEDERTRILANLQGEHPDDGDATNRGASLAQVRRAFGGTERSVRERLISVFNTPFAPDILVASSVMGEGIDLHQECRHVIHHDLDWNPGKLEQRTGRLDRIGSLAERAGRDIQIYEPYLAGTHDEKMYRVVKDRAGWFDIVMGRAATTDESTTDKQESRVPLHEVIRSALAMDLTCYSVNLETTKDSLDPTPNAEPPQT